MVGLGLTTGSDYYENRQFSDLRKEIWLNSPEFFITLPVLLLTVLPLFKMAESVTRLIL